MQSLAMSSAWVGGACLRCPDITAQHATPKASSSVCIACHPTATPLISSSPSNTIHAPNRRQVLQSGASALCQFTLVCMIGPAGAQEMSQQFHAPAQSQTADLPSTSQTASQYDSYASQYDRLDTGAAADAFGIPQLRQTLISSAYGNVLEVAVGTGINMPLYDRRKVQNLVGLDLSQGMLQQAESKVQQDGQGLQVSFQQGDVESLPFESSSFDCVVDTFSLCVFPRPLQALTELARVLAPGGKLLLLEHSRSKLPLLGWYQDITMPAVATMGKGCKWNQDVMGLLAEAGLKPTRTKTSLAGVITLVEAQKL